MRQCSPKSHSDRHDKYDVSVLSDKSQDNRLMGRPEYSDSERTPEKFRRSDSKFFYDEPESSRYGSSTKKLHSKYSIHL